MTHDNGNKKWDHFESSIWVFGDNIDTDQIISTRHYILPVDEMITHTLETVKPDFAKNVKKYDVIVAGKNFGCGSSREQAVTVFKELGVGAVIAPSFARIFYRNSINLALPVLECNDIDPSDFVDGDRVEVDIEKGHIVHLRTQRTYNFVKLPDFVREIISDGGLISYLLKSGR
jgi:3-isopropylmalate/(R)-2-methylmalate dehydratase small subunit